MKRKMLWVAVLCLAALPLGAQRLTGPVSIAVFVPGVAAGSPLYEQLVSGATRAASEYPNLSLKIVEGGFNQAEWAEKVTSLAATEEYRFILTSNPAMPFVCLDVAKAFPRQKFIIVDAFLPGNPQFYTLLYNQVEQAYFSGYLAGLVTKSRMKGATPELKVGMIVAQEYPVLTKMIRPGFERGFRDVDPAITLDYRVVGNWYDASKAADLAKSMMDSGVDVILTIAGGAAQGVLKAAQERGRYALWFDSSAYALAPGTIVGCSVLRQERAVHEVVKKAMEGELPFGTADVVDAAGGYVDFVQDDPLYIRTVPADLRARMADVVKRVRSGRLKLAVPLM
jgi:simple sugar transport system substrate-binding protein